MNKMSLKLLVLACCIAGYTSVANAKGCTLSDHKLDCGKGKRGDITAAFASKETADALRYPWFDTKNFDHPKDLESFRKSFEKSWKIVNNEAKVQERRLRHKRISSGQFDEWQKTYISARENYDRAVFYYRTLKWHGKTGKPAPLDD